MPLPSRPGLPEEPRRVPSFGEPQVPAFNSPPPSRITTAPVLPSTLEQPPGYLENEDTPVIPVEVYDEVPEYYNDEEYVESEEDVLDDDEDLDAEEKKRADILRSLSPRAKQSAQLLLQRISDDKSSEVLMNGPKNIMVKENGSRLLINDIKFESVQEYHDVINALILHDTDTPDRIGDAGNGDHLIEGQLELPDYDNPDNPPLFARVHVLTPPVVKAAKVTIAKKAKRSFRIDDFVQRGTMSPQMGAFLKACARGKATIVFSGLSGAGKTTLMEAMSYEFDENDRVVVIEDTAELRLPVYDVVPLLATSRKPGQEPSEIVTLEWLVAQANRMRPDRIIVGESRGGEFAEFLTAANSGADGSMTTIHASGPRHSLEKMRLLAMKSTTSRTENSVTRDIASTIQIIVQMGLIDGKHVITHIEEVSDTVTSTGAISLQPLYEYDRVSRRFIVKGRPSEKLTNFLLGRGVSIERAWFDRMQ